MSECDGGSCDRLGAVGTQAVAAFETKFKEKTGATYAQRARFKPKKGKYRYKEVNYSRSNEGVVMWQYWVRTHPAFECAQQFRAGLIASVVGYTGVGGRQRGRQAHSMVRLHPGGVRRRGRGVRGVGEQPLARRQVHRQRQLELPSGLQHTDADQRVDGQDEEDQTDCGRRT